METITLTYNGRWDFVKTPKTFTLSVDMNIHTFTHVIWKYIQNFGCKNAFASEFILQESVTNSVCTFESWEHMERFIIELYELLVVKESKNRFADKAMTMFKGLTEEQLEKTYLFMVSIGAGDKK